MSARQAEFEEAAFRHFDSMYAMALRLTRVPAEAEDLVQNALLRAWRFYDHFEPGSNLKAWLLKILMNGFINQYRRGARERSTREAHDPMLPGHTTISAEAMRGLLDPEGNALRPAVARELKNAVDSLPSDYRAVILLATVEELTYKEIADVLGCPIGTVMSRLHRARKLLQAHLQGYAEELGLVPAACAGQDRDRPDRSESSPPGEPASLDDYRRRRGHGS
ncbi:MAG: sigma-70 family RNA polymerase sigma factor [Proteobacteria bacterium]|nr:sigma-70 family RNA polymerase sigma factor [Pseudomonadota bacterium]